MKNDMVTNLQRKLSNNGQNPESTINEELLKYIEQIHQIDSVPQKLQQLKEDKDESICHALKNGESRLIKSYWRKKIQIIDALMSSIASWQDKKPIQALFDFNLALATIISPTDVVRTFSGKKMLVSSGEKARDLAWENYCRLGNDVANFLAHATKEEIDKKLESLTTVNLTDKTANIQIANNIITGEMSRDDAASFCYMMGLLCNIDYGYDTKPIRHSKEFVYNAYAATYGSIYDLQKAYDELVNPRNQTKIPTKPNTNKSDGQMV